MHFSLRFPLLAISWSLLYISALSYVEDFSATQLIGSHFGVPDIPATYDYVIVGGGTAGLVMARRLAANPSITVAVIEAGGFYEFDNGNYSEIPGYASQFTRTGTMMKNPLVDWYLYTSPQPGLGGRSLFYVSGKTFGGGSARNFLQYQRSSSGAFQRWANEVGDQSYTFDNLLPFFERSVHFNAPDAASLPANVSLPYNAAYFSDAGGPLQLSFPAYLNPISSWFGKALSSLGFARLPGFSDGRLFGWSYYPYSVDPASQTRSSTENSFLREALRETTNLNFYQRTQVKKVILDGCETATGVLVNTAGVEYTISAAKEVILSAGSFYSPQLLMVSGIGPADTLTAQNIPICANRPGVGQNMWDNIFSGPAYPVNVPTHNALANPLIAGAAVNGYNTQRIGLLTNTGGDFLAFEKLPNGTLSPATRRALDTTFGPDWPDVEYLEIDAYVGDETAPPPPSTIGQNYAALRPGLVAPFSRGNVTITSSDTADLPVISPNWLQDPRDREVLLAAFRRVRQFWANTTLHDVVTGPEAFPGANVTSDADLLDAVQRSAQTIWHACGTNKMGKMDDEMAVVDSKARVLGVKGLRVVDASAFPFLPPGQPVSMVLALAEKIAQGILDGE